MLPNNMLPAKPKIKVKSHKLRLGKFYNLRKEWWRSSDRLFKFIQTTPKGFNFLDVKTNRCIFKHHFYRSKYPSHQNNLKKGEYWFFINENIVVQEINVNEVLQVDHES